MLKIPSMAGLGNKARQIAPKVVSERPFKNILVSDKAEFAMRTNRAMPEGMPSGNMFSPSNIAGETARAVHDIAKPWRGNGSFGSKLKNAVTDVINNNKYKPGETWSDAKGNKFTNYHKRTVFGRVVHGATFSAPGLAATGYMMGDKTQPTGSRMAGAAGQALAFSRVGTPISGPVMLAKGGYDLISAGFKKKQPQQFTDMSTY